MKDASNFLSILLFLFSRMNFVQLLFFVILFSFSSSKDQDIREREEITSIKYYNIRLTPKMQNPKPRQSKLIQNSDFSAPDWMKNVRGSKKIFSLSIPGTHETCSRVGGPLVQCQDWSIQEQLLNGVRYLDIRCRHINDCFMIHHDLVYQQLSFGTGVRDVCIDFLKSHPSEFIFMQIKEEYTATENTRLFEETMQSYINSFEDYFYLTEKSPTLDEVRGKIVILRRFSSVISPLGNYLRFQDNAIFTSITTITARVQDCYNVPTLFDRAKKWENVNSLLLEALQNTDEDKLFINFGSGTSAFCYPYSVADYITPLIGVYVHINQPDAFTGVIMFDYINSNYDNLVYYIVKRNFN